MYTAHPTFTSFGASHDAFTSFVVASFYVPIFSASYHQRRAVRHFYDLTMAGSPNAITSKWLVLELIEIVAKTNSTIATIIAFLL